MLRLLPLKPNHRDHRGTITDLLVEPMDSATLVYTRAGAIRGNHYHRETFQWVYVISGKLRIVSADAEDVFRTGDLMLSPPLDPHAWEALEDTLVLVLTRGPRAGENYESDTFRLTEPLISG